MVNNTVDNRTRPVTFTTYTACDMRIWSTSVRDRNMIFKRVLTGLHDSCISQIDCSLSLYSLALTRVSFRDFPLRYEMRGGSLKIFLRYGWFCIRCHFPMSMFLRLGNAGWYCVTKGSIFLRAVLFLCSSAFSLSEKFTSERCFSTVAAG